MTRCSHWKTCHHPLCRASRPEPETFTCSTCGAPVGRLIQHIGPRHLDGIPYPFMYHTPSPRRR